jgi:hypothetical protein
MFEQASFVKKVFILAAIAAIRLPQIIDEMNILPR